MKLAKMFIENGAAGIHLRLDAGIMMVPSPPFAFKTSQ
jgi:hypothetical protein